MKKSKKDEEDFSCGYKTFNEVPPEKHKEVCFKVLKYWLKSYYKLNISAFPQSSVLKQDELLNGTMDSGDSLCLKLDIDNAIAKLPLKLKKMIYLSYILDMPVKKIKILLNYKFRIDCYRKLDECFEKLYEILGTNWLRN